MSTTGSAFEQYLPYGAYALLILSGVFAAFGLSTRVPPQSVPPEILDSNGTLPGFVLASVFVGAALLTTEVWKPTWLAAAIPWTLFHVGIGVYTFASGASMLSWNNNNRSVV